jgi:hypothetical protein
MIKTKTLTAADAARDSLRFTYWNVPRVNPWFTTHLLGTTPPTDLDIALETVISDGTGQSLEQVRAIREGVATEWLRNQLNADPLFNDKAAPQAMSDDHRLRYEAGDSDAIFDYVKQDRWAFRAPWVVAQIELWRAKHETKQLGRLMSVYAGTRNATSPDRLRWIIRRDQALYRHLLTRSAGISIEKTFGDAADTFRFDGERISASTAKEVYKRYKQLHSMVTEVMSNEEFFDSLAAMADAL